jgi:hypothetical protein
MKVGHLANFSFFFGQLAKKLKYEGLEVCVQRRHGSAGELHDLGLDADRVRRGVLALALLGNGKRLRAAARVWNLEVHDGGQTCSEC